MRKNIEGIDDRNERSLESIAQFCEILMAFYPTIWGIETDPEERAIWRCISVIHEYTRHRLDPKFPVNARSLLFVEGLLKNIPDVSAEKLAITEIWK